MFNFTESATVKEIDSVPEKYRGLYSEGTNDAGETVFKVSDAAKGLVEDYTGTGTELERVRGDKTKASNESAERRKALGIFDDLMDTLGIEERSAENLKLYIEELTGKVKGGEEIKINLDKIKEQYQHKHDEAIGVKDVEVKDMLGALTKHLISDVATRALAEAKGSVDLLLPHVERHCKMVRLDDGNYAVRVVDSEGDVRTDGGGGYIGVPDLVGEMKTQDSFARAFESETNSGTGTNPGSMSRATTQKSTGQRELNGTEKISLGLSKNQHISGGGGRIA